MPKPLKITRNIAVSDIATFQNSDGVEVLILSGCAYKYKDNSGKYFIDSDWENVDTNQLDLSRIFSTDNMPLLFNHNHDKVVGKVIAADKRKDGLYITAELYNFPDDSLSDYITPRVKKGLINSFSIGFVVHEVDVIEQDEEEYLQISKGEMIECSLVAVPANSNAVFDTVGRTEKGITFGISKSTLKEDNPNICTDLESCGLLNKPKSGSKTTNHNKKTILLDENTVIKGSEVPDNKKPDSEGQPQLQTEGQIKEDNNDSSNDSDTQPQDTTTELNKPVENPKVETKPKEEPKDTPTGNPKEEPKDTPTENLKENSTEEPKDTLKENSTEEPKDTPTESPKENSAEESKAETQKPSIQEVIQTIREVDVEEMPEDDLGDLIEAILPLADMFYEAVEEGLQEELQSA